MRVTLLVQKGKLPSYPSVMGFPDGSVGKESACDGGDTGDAGLPPGLGRFPWRRKWQPTPVFLPGESHGQRRPVGCSPGGSQRVRQLSHSAQDALPSVIKLRPWRQ